MDFVEAKANIQPISTAALSNLVLSKVDDDDDDDDDIGYWILAWDNYATLLSTKATSSQYQFATTTISSPSMHMLEKIGDFHYK